MVVADRGKTVAPCSMGYCGSYAPVRRALLCQIITHLIKRAIDGFSNGRGRAF
jgi:hypothetical protein